MCIEWKAACSIGVPRIDEQHCQLMMAFLSNWGLSHILVRGMEPGRLVRQARQDANG